MTEASNQQEINLFQLSLEQLNSLKGQHEEEIQQLNRQAETLLGARNRFLTTRATLQQLNQGKEGDQLLVPLNSSLYVPGTMVTPQKVVVELGTGYYCEKEVPAALELIDRKVICVV
ncbi:prefoldin subunit alpha [archaeon]|nr:MAG: prefoldin subunit alpha [archaeon]